MKTGIYSFDISTGGNRKYLNWLSCRIFWAQFLFVKNIANCLTQIPRFYWLNKVRATAGCELLRVRAARVVTLKNRVRVAAVVRDAVWCEPRGFFSEFIIKKVRAAVGCELLRVRAARVVTLKNRRMWCGPRRCGCEPRLGASRVK